MKTQFLSLLGGVAMLTSFHSPLLGQLSATFSIDDSSACLGQALQFTDLSIGNPTSWTWNFGDGGTSTQQNPTYTYAQAGSYTVSLQVSDGSATADTSLTVTVDNLNLQVAVDAINPVCVPAEITVTNQSFNFPQGTSFSWEFTGSSFVDSVTVPFHVFYHDPGNFFIKLMAETPLGCTDTFVHDLVTIPSPISITGTVTDVGCDSANSGAIDITITGDNGIAFISWSNGASAEDLNSIPSGTYRVFVTDFDQCTARDTFVVKSPYELAVRGDTIACDSSLGNLSTQVAIGVPPYQYLWSTGDTTPNLTQVPIGGYSVTVTDATGCSVHKVGFVEYADSCLVDIQVYAFLDSNLNCIQDPGEHEVLSLVNLSDQSQTFSQSKVLTPGFGALYKVFPDSFILTPDSAYLPVPLQCPASGSFDLGFVNQDTTLYVAYQVPSQSNLALSLDVSPVRPIIPHTYRAWVYNLGQGTDSAYFYLRHDSIVSLSMPTGGNYDPATRTLEMLLPPIPTGQFIQIKLNGIGPAVPNTGDSVFSEAWVEVAGDTDTTDNYASVSQVVVNSFDPNDKQVSPLGELAEGYIHPDEQQMHYTIRFQNTGTDTAFYVAIRDTIDTDLSLESLRLGPASHDYSLTINGRTLIFEFNNILLPDSNTDVSGSQGFVSFDLQHRQRLNDGTQIKNRAGIYFDFNQPVITNTVLNTVATTVSIDPLTEVVGRVYPNPATGLVRLELADALAHSLEVRDLQGRVIRRQGFSPRQQVEIDVSTYSSGVYLVRVHTSKGMFLAKLSVL